MPRSEIDINADSVLDFDLITYQILDFAAFWETEMTSYFSAVASRNPRIISVSFY